MKLALALFLWTTNFFFSYDRPLVPTNYYIDSKDGDTTGTGTSTNPWKTLSQANTKWASGNLNAGDSILLKRGQTFVGTLKFGESGTSTNNFIVAAYGTGSKPKISGYTTIQWEASGTGTTHIWRNKNTTTPLTAGDINLVTVNNTVTGIGRYPDADANNGGYLNLTSFSGTTSITSKNKYDASLASGQSSHLEGKDNDYSLESPEIPAMDLNWTGAQIIVRTERWIISKGVISNHDTTTDQITMPTDGDLNEAPTAEGFGFFITKDLRLLNKNGEWWYNNSASPKRLYMYNFGSAPSNVKAATIDILLNSNGKDYVTVIGIDFEGANSRAIDITSASDFVKITNCKIDGSGDIGVLATGQSSRLEYDTVLNSASNGIVVGKFFLGSIGTGDGAGEGDSSYVGNCVITNVGQIAGMGQYGQYQGIGMMVASHHVTAEYNTISWTAYCGMFLYYRDHILFQYNVIKNYCNVLDDGGGIYTVNSTDERTNDDRVWKYCMVFNGIGAGYGTNFGNQSDGPGSKAKGFYIDNDANNVSIINCFAYNTQRGIYLNNGASYNTVTNNTVVNSYFGSLVLNSRLADITSNNTITNNLFFIGDTTLNAGKTIIYQIRANEFTTYLTSNYGTINNNKYYSPMSKNTDNAKLVRERTQVVTTTSSGNGSTVTLGHTTKSGLMFPVGTTIVVAGVTPASYNGTFTVTSATNSTVSYSDNATGSQTVSGTISISGTRNGTIGQWRISSGQDASSVLSPFKFLDGADRDSIIRIEWNDTKVNKTISMQATYEDVKTLNQYARSITLAPFTGVVLRKLTALTPDIAKRRWCCDNLWSAGIERGSYRNHKKGPGR